MAGADQGAAGMAANDISRAELTCGNCECYQPRHQDALLAAAAERAGHPVSPGLCRRFPLWQTRQPFESCGEHSELAKRRMHYQAELLGQALAAALAKGQR